MAKNPTLQGGSLLPAWIRKLQRWANQNPDSFGGAALLASPFLAILAYELDGFIGSLFLILLLTLVFGSVIHLSNVEQERKSNLRSYIADIRSFTECECLHEYNTCPVRSEEGCHCLCHRIEMYITHSR